ncbi:MAG: hypothetical protein PUE15_10780 [Prevotella sp.]|nr:hypothetical protein [Prevotella sp.]
MKYFKNITTPEELKKQFRALSIQLHPDRGGNAEEFKAMMAEYNNIMRNFDQAKERAEAEAEARRQAEEYAKAEAKRKAEEEEAARKAAEAMRPVIAKWSALLERVQPKAHYIYPDAAYLAALKRNIKAVFAKYFPGVAVSVNINNKHWSEKAEIRWTDGPTLEEAEAVQELLYFIASIHMSGPYGDYGDVVEIKYNKAWREAFGEIQAQRFTFTRDFSEQGKAEVLGKIREILPQFADVDAQSGTARMSSADCATLARFFGFSYDYKGREYSELNEEERAAADVYDHKYRMKQRHCRTFESKNYYGGVTPLRCLVDFFRTYYHISDATAKAAQEAAAAPKFTPKHNATYRAVVKALGGNFFAASNDGQEWDQRKPITPAEAAELLAKGVRVDLVKYWEGCDHKEHISAVEAGGHRTQEKRAAKFAAAGFTVQLTGLYKGVQFVAVSPEGLAELRKDAESVAKQREAWEAAQREDKTTRKAQAEPKAAEQTADTDTATNDEAPAEGLELVEIPGGVAVSGDSRTTYRYRKQIKANGATWSKEAQQWQATDPGAVARLRRWFGMDEPTTGQAEQTEHTLHGKRASRRDAPEPTVEEVELTTRFAALLADVVRMFETIATAAQEEAQRAKETATKQAEVEQLRADIARMSEQVMKMSEALRTMSERLDQLEATTDTRTDTEPQPEDQAQERPERGEGKPDALDMLRAAAEDAARLTASNDHTAALLARLYVLAAVGLRVRPLIERAKAIEAAHQRGFLTPDEVSDRQSISQEAERRAALLLTPDEFRALYGHDPKAASKAA